MSSMMRSYPLRSMTAPVSNESSPSADQSQSAARVMVEEPEPEVKPSK